MEIKVPLLKHDTGLGDIVKAATLAIGFKPCARCEESARKLNESLRFSPRWTNPPQPAEGWAIVTLASLPEKQVGLYRRIEHHPWIVWEIIGGRYQNSYSFCCGENPEKSARAKFEELCR